MLLLSWFVALPCALASEVTVHASSGSRTAEVVIPFDSEGDGKLKLGGTRLDVHIRRTPADAASTFLVTVVDTKGATVCNAELVVPEEQSAWFASTATLPSGQTITLRVDGQD